MTLHRENLMTRNRNCPERSPNTKPLKIFRTGEHLAAWAFHVGRVHARHHSFEARPPLRLGLI
jgi:hypothetical protein